eukprot:8932932-Alexandrium_andersonii.AAC.1
MAGGQAAARFRGESAQRWPARRPTPAASVAPRGGIPPLRLAAPSRPPWQAHPPPHLRNRSN